MADTEIEWTDTSWNPTTGCDKVSPGCGLPRWPGDDTGGCYAMSMAKRLKAMGQAKYQTDGDPRTSGPGFGVAVHDDALTIPLRWRKPRKVFVNSMSDLWHAKVPREFVARAFAVMASTPRHTYQILTKRPERMARMLNDPKFRQSVQRRIPYVGEDPYVRKYHREWPLPNVWLGTSVEDQERADQRIPALLETPAAVRWLSCEPLLGEVNLAPDDHSGHERDCQGTHYECLECSTEDEPVEWVMQEMPPLDWVVVGGESGKGARPMDLEWARLLVRQCQAAGTAVFVKQLGSCWGKGHHDIDQFPEDLRIREYPEVAHV